ncbi:MAG: hypothetical protein E7242_00975 [Lachnospiraceae bacterium]|nr:hypothetical protein [Lachnospiraceae bacterium]
MNFEYYYSEESSQFKHLCIPMDLFDSPYFEHLSNDARLLYSIMLDRVSLSRKNGWVDDQGRVFIYLTLEEACKKIKVGSTKCVKIFAELDSEKGVGLIERKKQGQGRPTKLYVKNFCKVLSKLDDNSSDCESLKGDKPDDESTFDTVEGSNNHRYSRLTKNESLNFQKKNPPKCESLDLQENLRLSENESLNFQYAKANHTDINHTELYNSINQSSNNNIYISEQEDDQLIDERQVDETQRIIKANIEYDDYMSVATIKNKELFDDLYRIMVDIVCFNRKSFTASGCEIPAKLLRAKFLKLKRQNLEYVIENLNSVTTKITNIYSYLVAALYSSDTAINAYWHQMVQHDLYGDKTQSLSSSLSGTEEPYIEYNKLE